MTSSGIRISWLLVSVVAYWLLAYAVPRAEFGALIGLYGLLFAGYGWQVQTLLSNERLDNQNLDQPLDRFMFGAAIGFRLLLIPALPHLSDDYARFIWDGRLLAHGYNPYLYLPSQLINTATATAAGLTTDLFQALNSPHYFTVYPPVEQALFGLAAWLSPTSIPGNVIGLRVPILLAELGSMWLMVNLLRRSGQNPNRALLYGLNPLVILELTGNLHAEAIMIFWVLLAVWLVERGWLMGSAGALALAVGTKLLPLLLFPLVIRHLGWRRCLTYTGLTGLLTAGLFAPFFSLDLVQNTGASLGLYVHTFVFNAPVYQAVRAGANAITGTNTSTGTGIGLALLTLTGTGWIAWRWGRQKPVQAVLLTLTVYYFLATTVHPWYITLLVAVGVFTRLRYPLIWSALVWLSYATYQTTPYHENGWLTGLAWILLVGSISRELLRKTTNTSSL